MSVDLNYYIEAKGSDGKWRLVTWTDCENEIHNERYGNLILRDKLSSLSFNRTHDVPDDVSDELKAILVDRAANTKNFFDEAVRTEWNRVCSCIGLDELYELCDEEHEILKKSIVYRAGHTAMDDIARRLDRIENLVNGKPVPVKKKKREEEDEKPINYEDALGFILDDEMFDYVGLKCECAAIRAIASTFMPYLRWSGGENIRIVYYFS